MTRGEYDCTVTGTDGVDLPAGTVVTGSAVRDVVLANGVVRVLYTPRVPDVERGGHMLQRRVGDEYVDVYRPKYGDYTYFKRAIGVTCDRVVVLENTAARVKVVFEWTAFSLNEGDGGVLIINPDGSLSYPEGSSTPKRIATTKLRKVIVLCQGREGYFVGYHTDPLVGPTGANLTIGSSWNNENALGEREIGPGEGVAVGFTSAGVTSRHPEWGQKTEWDDLEAELGQTYVNHMAWSGIDDPYYTTPTYQLPEFAATQADGFPGTQSTGPWWTASLDADNATYPFCRYVVQRKPLESGVWQYGDEYGIHVNHFMNEWHDDDGRPYETMIFLGAYPYESEEDLETVDGRAAEPTQSLQDAVAARAAGDFDACGRAPEVAVFRHTATTVRER
jgi:hypothetical protein